MSGQPMARDWLYAWAVFAVLSVAWIVLILVAPDCEIPGTVCGDFSQFNVGLFGAPVVFAAAAVAAWLTTRAWLRAQR